MSLCTCMYSVRLFVCMCVHTCIDNFSHSSRRSIRRPVIIAELVPYSVIRQNVLDITFYGLSLTRYDIRGTGTGVAGMNF